MKKLREVKSHKLNGRKYEILIGEFDGFVDGPKNNRTMVINCDLNTQKGLRVLIHEAIHASMPTMHEDTVDRLSREVGSLAWRLGYRRNAEII